MKTMFGFLRSVRGSTNRPSQGLGGLMLMSLARPR